MQPMRAEPARQKERRGGTALAGGIAFGVLVSMSFTACGSPRPAADSVAHGAGDSSAAAVRRPASDGRAGILLFTGRGTSPDDAAALERILGGSGLRYSTAGSSRLDAMGESDLAAYQLLIIPGGNFAEMGHGIGVNTTAKIRNAVAGGLGYLGICAGAFLAGNSPYNGLNLTSGVRFTFYAA